MSGVQTGPGATALTRIPCGARSCASDMVKVAMAPLVVAYGSSVGNGVIASTELVLMIDPPGRMCGTAALAR
jgi:hypothetical protein